MKLPQSIEDDHVERVRSRLKSVQPTRTLREKVLAGFEREIMRLHDGARGRSRSRAVRQEKARRRCEKGGEDD